MESKEKCPVSISIIGQGKRKKHVKDKNFDLQLQFPWIDQLLQESQQIIEKKTSPDSAIHEPLQQGAESERSQVTIEQGNGIYGTETQLELSCMVSTLTAPQKSAPPDSIMSNDGSTPIKELPESFIGKGEVRNFKFTQIKKSLSAYVYQVQSEGGLHFEVFLRKINSLYGNVSYPNSNAFGAWAWTTNDQQRAMEIFDTIYLRKDCHGFETVY